MSPISLESIFAALFQAGSRWAKGHDQSILSQVVWPRVKDEAVAHDAYLCRNYRSRHTRPWPTRRERGPLNFVGSIGLMEITTDCPADRRPEEHKDWNMC